MPLSEFHSWSVQDRAMALALQEYEAGLCPGCGGHLAETADDENRWHASKPVRCFKCTAIAGEMEHWEKQPHPQALHFTARPRRRRRDRP